MSEKGISQLSVRQHGAMEFSTPPVDLDQVRNYRYGRVQAELKRRDLVGIVLFDQLNTRYATDATNMQIWCMHNETRYVWVPAEGPAILFDYGRDGFLADGLPNIGEQRSASTFFYYSSGPTIEARAKLWAAELADIVRQAGGHNNRIAMDRVSPLGTQLLEAEGLKIFDGFEVMEQVRRIKSPEEVVLMQAAINACEDAIGVMRGYLEPGVTENALFAKLAGRNIELGGEWMECRLLASGPRTNPWMHEASMRRVEEGDIMAFDTDLVGPYGYCADISRTWVCGDKRGTDEQRRLHAAALEQVDYNMRLFKPGRTFREISELAWNIPDEFIRGRYSVVAHGIGLCDEYPGIKHDIDFEKRGYDGVIEEGMCFCVESYIGADGGREGIKFEEQIVITENGYRQLSSYPMDENLM